MGEQPVDLGVGMDAWEEKPYPFDSNYSVFTCRLCLGNRPPEGQRGWWVYNTGRVWPGSSRANEAMMQHLRDKHGVAK